VAPASSTAEAEKKVVQAIKRPATPKPVEVVGPPREVTVRITGATGGALKIDGEEKDWFGVTHTLELGEHLFEFVPPNETCCVPSRRRVVIEAGEGVQQVVGRIKFRDAVLAVEGGGAGELSCPTLFSGSLAVPGQRSIPMSRPEESGSCTLSPKGSAPTRKVVTLRAGQTSEVTWP
jgi:hypothetical protein